MTGSHDARTISPSGLEGGGRRFNVRLHPRLLALLAQVVVIAVALGVGVPRARFWGW